MLTELLLATCLLAGVETNDVAARDVGTPAALNAADFEGWCTTFERWRLRGVANEIPTAGGCPIEGDCDMPEVRDGYLTNENTTFLVVRMHLNIFRADDGSDPAASPEDVVDRMEELNRDYGPWRVRFVYSWRYVDDSTFRYGGNDSTMKSLYAVDPHRQCNFYVRGSNQSAYGTFPWDPNATGTQGGVVCGSPFFTNAEHVPTHEMGHNLGLWHTHHGVSEVGSCTACYERADGQNGDTTGDFASDTPPTPVNLTCDDPGGNDQCSGVPWGDTLPEDYMSYGFFDPDPCWDRFTPQQGARMHCWITSVLGGWLACVADLNDDGSTGFSDLLDLLAAWGPCDACNADIDGNGIVEFNDLLILLAEWGACV